MYRNQDTIAAICTPPGSGALGIIRVSGDNALSIVAAIFGPKDLNQAKGYTLHYGNLYKSGKILDEVLVSVFKAPKSFTKEDVVEISCHGSAYILREALQLLVDAGARLAEAGEFTQRAYLNGAMDLAQAEAVADLIASNSSAAHQLAINQLRGGVSHELKNLRQQLLDFTSLIELELDFSEEDVEFADRTQLMELIQHISKRTAALIESFQFGNAVKEGVPTVIMGKPNAGKSTLLNALLNDNRAIVSDIPGTTRDVIEDRLLIKGIEFRLQDTAGVRETVDVIEAEGVSRTLALAQKASLIIYLFDLRNETPAQARDYLQSLNLPEHAQPLVIGNKYDLLENPQAYESTHDPDHMPYPWIAISAKEQIHLAALKTLMTDAVQNFSAHSSDQAIISNIRHLNALKQAQTALEEVQQGLEIGLTGDLLTIDIRTVLHYIGEITGEITNDEVLGNIFGKFCIGK